MTLREDPASVYRDLGVRPAITASGATTAYGGSKLRPEVMEAMNSAATVMVEVAELHRAAGKVIAELTGAEAGLVASGAAGGLVLQAAACVAGSDPIKMAQLPDTTGMKNEIIIQRSHRFAYDQSYRAAGATLVDIGDGRRTQPWQLEAALYGADGGRRLPGVALRVEARADAAQGLRDRPCTRRPRGRGRGLDAASQG